VLAWLSVWDEVQICIWFSRCHCHSLSLAAVNPDWFYLPGFTFLVQAHLGGPGQIQKSRKTIVVVVVVVTCIVGWLTLGFAMHVYGSYAYFIGSH